MQLPTIRTDWSHLFLASLSIRHIYYPKAVVVVVPVKAQLAKMGRDFTGKYQCTGKTGFEDFMEELGNAPDDPGPYHLGIQAYCKRFFTELR